MSGKFHFPLLPALPLRPTADPRHSVNVGIWQHAQQTQRSKSGPLPATSLHSKRRSLATSAGSGMQHSAPTAHTSSRQARTMWQGCGSWLREKPSGSTMVIIGQRFVLHSMMLVWPDHNHTRLACHFWPKKKRRYPRAEVCG